MDWSELKGIVGKAAPVVGTLLGGPAGAAVGGLIASALGTENTPDAVSNALLANPDALVKLQELQVNAKVQLQQLEVAAELNRLTAQTAQFSAEAADRDSARKLAATQPNDWVRPTITIIMIAGAVAILGILFSGLLDLRNAVVTGFVGTIIGYWFNELKQVLAFWFGTTGDTLRQNQAITQFAVTPGTVSAPSTDAAVQVPITSSQSVTVEPGSQDRS